MPSLQAFAALGASDAHTRILGRMPGAASLAAELPYDQHARTVQERGFVRDVLGARAARQQ